MKKDILVRSMFSLFAMIAISLFFLYNTSTAYGQFSSIKKNPYHARYHDSLKNMNYPYTFPLMAKKAYKRGFDIPYTFGISTMYYTQRQNVSVPKTLIGFNDGQLVDMSDFIRFGDIVATTHAFTVRPDMWLFPFLNIYGIFGVGNTSTKVPLVRPVNFTTTQKFNVKSVGFGATVAAGVGPVFVVIDNNVNYADVESLAEPVPAYNLDIRVGHNFVNPRRADRGLAVWVGAFYQHLSADTKGTITVKDLFPDGSNDLQDHFIAHLEEWADGLPPAQKVVANQIIDKIDDYLNGIDIGDTRINYELDKKVVQPWNMVIGMQYQLNKHWQFRTEVGTFGKRSSCLLMANYRFEHIGKKKSK